MEIKNEKSVMGLVPGAIALVGALGVTLFLAAGFGSAKGQIQAGFSHGTPSTLAVSFNR